MALAGGFGICRVFPEKKSFGRWCRIGVCSAQAAGGLLPDVPIRIPTCAVGREDRPSRPIFQSQDFKRTRSHCPSVRQEPVTEFSPGERLALTIVVAPRILNDACDGPNRI
jgi:hypothetical protein